MNSALAKSEMLDCVIVGAGMAGLTAALYLQRFGRRFQLIDAGKSRARSIVKCRNFPGFPDGIGGKELLKNLRCQLGSEGGCVVPGEVQGLQKTPDETGFLVRLDNRNVKARTVLLATGTVDELPSVPGAALLWHRGLLRQCPICDGPDHRGKRIAVFGDGEHAEREADFLAGFSDRVALLGPPKAARVRVSEDGIEVGLRTGAVLQFDVAYAAVGTKPQAGLAVSVGVMLDDNGAVDIDAHCRTSVPGLYAAGDVTSGLSQLVVAASHGAIAATDIHNVCRTG